MDPKRFLKLTETAMTLNPLDPLNYRIDFIHFKDMTLVSKEMEIKFKQKFPDYQPIPRNRIRGSGITTKVEIEPKDF